LGMNGRLQVRWRYPTLARLPTTVAAARVAWPTGLTIAAPAVPNAEANELTTGM
jgi:hypothetical protein